MDSTCLPPEPRRWSISQTAAFFKDPIGLIREAFETCGENFTLHLLGLGRWVFVGSPDLAKAIFQAPLEELEAGKVNDEQIGFLLGSDSILCSDGDEHLRRRKLFHPLLNGSRALEQIGLVRELTTKTIESWPEDEPVRFIDAAYRISLETMVRAFFRDSPADRLHEVLESVEILNTKGLTSPLMIAPPLRVNFGPWSPWGKILAMRKRAADAIRFEIEQRMEHEGDGSYDDLMAAMCAMPGPDGGRFQPETLVDEAITILVAGHETTGAVESWAIERLCRNPECLEKLRDEIDGVLGDDPIEASHLRQLPYLRAVINESIRQRPSAPMAGVRRTRVPFELGEYRLPEGTTIIHCVPALGLREEVFAHPEEYDPTSHFEGRRIKPYEWNAFGGGTRLCLGKGLAEVELAVITATLVQLLDFRMVHDDEPPARHGIFLAPEQGLQLSCRRRRRPIPQA